MIYFSGIILATIVLFIPGLHGQCVDCAQTWKTDCRPKETGFYCMRGAELTSEVLTYSEYATSTRDPGNMYAHCVPYPYHLEYVPSWCCFWSKVIGCQIAVHPRLLRQLSPQSHCDHCRDKCKCGDNKATVAVQPWHWNYLISLTVLLTVFNCI
ncbi:uncharacterized protein LOC116805897 [Drosophila grimshawi]|uniref:uncharacterized protein LOC116805897 n=1 Tax=Drosophila grimshawi TaxID=7222 RepID=UPI000C86F1B3|nr:uncharacterized protein LOC116805897 [Drosophila grimshawi]